MKVGTLVSPARSGRLLLLGRLPRVIEPIRGRKFLASTGCADLLQAQHAGPVEEGALLARRAPGPRGQDAVRVWLELSVRIGERSSTEGGRAPRGALARALPRPGNGEVLARS